MAREPSHDVGKLLLLSEWSTSRVSRVVGRANRVSSKSSVDVMRLMLVTVQLSTEDSGDKEEPE